MERSAEERKRQAVTKLAMTCMISRLSASSCSSVSTLFLYVSPFCSLPPSPLIYLPFSRATEYPGNSLVGSRLMHLAPDVESVTSFKCSRKEKIEKC